MTDIVKQILAKPIQLADQVIKSADEACINKQDCSELKSKTEKLAGLLRQAARASNDLYERPTKRIIEDTEQVLEKALSLVLKCRNNGLVKRVFTIIPAAAFRKMSSQLENSIGDVSWLLRVSAPNNSTDEYLGLPPIAANEPILCLIWEQIAILYTGTLDDRSDAAASLVSLARDNDRYGKLIIEEGGVNPLLKLAKEGKLEGQENAALAIGLLGRDPESVEHMIHAGVCSVFVKILKEGPMKVQAVVAWAVAELVSHYPKCQDLFAQHNIVRLLVGHLAFETVEEHSKYAITSNKPTSIHAVVLASNNNSNSNSNNVGSNSNGLSNSQTNKGPVNNDEDEDKNRVAHPTGSNPQQPFRMHSVVTSTMAMKNQTRPPSGNGLGPNANQKPENVAVKKQNHHHYTSVSLSANSLHKGRELEDPATKAYMKAMAARALWHLAIGNSAICRSITESRALLCFAVLLEKGPEEVQFNSAMALMEITSVAEQDSELRRSAFKPNSPACKAVIEQLLKVIEKADSKLLLPCVKAIGNLARTFRATESQMIQPLVQLLDEREAEITRAATIALSKFACSENYLHLDHSKAIINAGGAKHLVQLVYFGEHMVQTPALVLLCYIALHVPDSEDLAQAEVLTVLEWASKQSPLIQDEQVESLLQNSKSRLELYQSRGSRGFH
ncbi:putative adaptor protein Cbl domain superfamily [Helianthus annuus]|nr:putative adaptor protein Cbl domain superfamily [Helianthus annuus]KAJ0823552.1 putative adaptor protein Cbl domain superfamily [Helianthus annuus]